MDLSIQNMKKVLVFGTFDLLHKGHEYFLREARKKGDRLYVVVGRDINVRKIKGKAPVQDEQKRLEKISRLDYVYHALLGREDHKYMKIIEDIKPDIISLGYDQESFGLEKEIHRRELSIKLVRLSPYKQSKYKTSILRQLLNF